MTEYLRTVDLFSGCGGLALGFELGTEDRRFRTVMAIDNHPPAVRCFNDNHPRRADCLSIGRVADVTWFAHPSEIVLYYLTHLALTGQDEQLKEDLFGRHVALRGFLSAQQQHDALWAGHLADLAATSEYATAFKAVDDRAMSLAVVRATMSNLGFASLRYGRLALSAQPWNEEAAAIRAPRTPRKDDLSHRPLPTLSRAAEELWENEIARLAASATRSGRGQHVVVSGRAESLVSFLTSNAGQRLRDLWCSWRAGRDSLRADYCLSVAPALDALYASRRVQVILGGPPCKGFSRMGRAAIEDLRAQGAHAWAHHEYGDERNLLMHKYVLFLQALRPDVFLFENVPQFTTTLRTPGGTLDAADVLAEAISELSGHDLNYEVTSEIVNARQHAVPQDRARFFMVGFNGATTPARDLSDAFFPLSTQAGEVSLAAALSGLDTPAVFSPSKEMSAGTGTKIAAYTLVDSRMPAPQHAFVTWIRQRSPVSGRVPTTVDGHVFRAPRADDLAFIKKFAPGHRWMDYKLKRTQTLDDLRSVLSTLAELPEADYPDAIGSRDKLEELASRVDENLLLRLMLESIEPEIGCEHHLLLPGYLSKGDGRHGDWFERLKPNRPSKTIIAHIGKDTYAYVHPFENRPITIREAARIQSFPDWYSFGSVGVVDGYAMIGNAVPPLLAAELARRLVELDRSLTLFLSDERERSASVLERQLSLSDSLESDSEALGYERHQTPELVE